MNAGGPSSNPCLLHMGHEEETKGPLLGLGIHSLSNLGLKGWSHPDQNSHMALQFPTTLNGFRVPSKEGPNALAENTNPSLSSAFPPIPEFINRGTRVASCGKFVGEIVCTRQGIQHPRLCPLIASDAPQSPLPLNMTSTHSPAPRVTTAVSASAHQREECQSVWPTQGLAPPISSALLPTLTNPSSTRRKPQMKR